ncbi:MAG: 3-phosphoshikimate 1-carboxyvinyltransferase [Nibricoccus sp.]
MPLPDLLPIQPFTRPVRGSVELPGSKSITNRALLLAVLCARPVTLTGALFSEDTEIMAEALRQLGFVVKENAAAKTIYVEGRRGKIPAEKATLHVGLAGTAARFLTALCAAAPNGVYHIDGVPQMRKRPMKGLFDALSNQGTEIIYIGENGFFPIELRAHGLRGGTVEIDASESSQMLSALLMVAPLAASALEIKLIGKVRWPFVQMTVNQMAQFGFETEISPEKNAVTISPGYYLRASTYAIEPDATAASYFLALPLVTRGLLHLPGLFGDTKSLQGDTRFIRVVRGCGAVVEDRLEPNRVPKDVGKSDDRAVGIDAAYYAAVKIKGAGTQDFREFSDTFLTLGAIAPLFDGPTKITGIAHTRKQETDRVAGMARELKKLGQEVIETEDSLEIHPRPLKAGVTIETHGDHRFAMSFAILGCHDLLGNGQPWLTIRNPACCAKTFPNFFDVLGVLWKNSHSST